MTSPNPAGYFSSRFQQWIEQCARNAASAHNEPLSPPSTDPHIFVRVVENHLSGNEDEAAREIKQLSPIELLYVMDTLMRHGSGDWLAVRDTVTKLITKGLT